MTRKIADAVLLLMCFGALGILSGAVPVMADEAAAAETIAEAPQPTQEETPQPELSPTPAPTDTPAPTPTPAPDDAWAEDVAVLSTTITGSGLIDNDTYYDLDPQSLLAEGF